ncbi:MAG: putative bifunctional diguanylate cyclase/phosphodiesterase, partial [Oscillospiraceae bacterium]
FEHYAERALNSPFSSRKLIAVVDLTIMKYRSFCAYHGVEEGENLLERTDRFLSSVISKKEYCAYMGKASFALLLNCESKEECEDRLYRIMNGLPRAINHDNAVFHCGVFFAEPAQSDSILIKRKDTNISELYSYAGSARAAIADESANGVAIFDRALLEAQLWEHKVEEKMQKALENEEFVVYIQPKYNPVTNKLAGAEALVRWINEEDGFIPPGKFIPIFEKDGFIPKLDDYMISHVAKLQAEWLKEGKMLVPISVNVSRAHFATPNLAQHICGLVDVYGVPHRFIEIELTESAFFDDKNILLNTVNELKAAGFKVSMDDFGAGYSSLNSLKDLPLDVLKLDADFFRGGEAERGEIVVSEAIQLAKKLNMKVVAEGVEKKNQVDFLAEHGCDMIQGYYYAKPMPADEYKEKMRLCEYPIVGELPQLIEKQQ